MSAIYKSWLVDENMVSIFYNYIIQNYPEYYWDNFTEKDLLECISLSNKLHKNDPEICYLETDDEGEKFFMCTNLSHYTKWGYLEQVNPIKFTQD